MAAGAAAAGDGAFGGFWELGCLSNHDTGIERRPYHRNCSCALHSMRGRCQHSLFKANAISYPVRRSWSEGCLMVVSGRASPADSSSSPAQPALRKTYDLVQAFYDLDDHSLLV